MKIRQGFVSNSSSSSFIIVTKERLTEAFLRQEYAEAGKFAEPLIHFLLWRGENDLADLYEYLDQSPFGQDDGLTPMDRWRRANQVAPDEYVLEYEITNQGSSEVSQALYYKGYDHLETKNIRVLPGTRWG